MTGNYRIEEFDYHLPEEKIAKYPLQKREESKLLVYREGKISQSCFKNILDYLPAQSLLLFNDTKVIAARLIFHKPTGARIEIFLLEPVFPYDDFTRAMEVKHACTWKCTIGNKKKWKEGRLMLEFPAGERKMILHAAYDNREKDRVRFEWGEEFSFAEVLQQAGKIPIPPYLERGEKEIDKERYQTVYSQWEGAVAAPTAGLHFTREIIDTLPKKDIASDFVTLHVSAGTFKPVQAENYLDHDMHCEQVIVRRSTIETLLKYEKVICVGTTSLRTLESLYWMGVKKILNIDRFTFVDKLLPYSFEKIKLPSKNEALLALLHDMDQKNAGTLYGQTEIFIFPGYEFRMCNGLITNFHLPKSTLLLLIGALIGKDWEKVYQVALENDFRFLSYGDSSILLP